MLRLLLALVLLGLLAAPATSAGPPPLAAGEPPPAAAPLAHGRAFVERLQLAAHPARWRRSASPAVDSVEDGPGRWRPQDAPKPQFVTKRGHDVGTYGARALPDDAPSTRFNEIPLPERGPAPYTRYDAPAAYRPVGDAYGAPPRPAPQRRVVYYADLPEVTRPRARLSADPRSYSGRDYDPYARDGPKYPRESRYEERSPFRAYDRDDWHRYRSAPPPAAPNSYAIIDAERSARPSQLAPGPYSAGRPYGDPDPMSRYNRVPAPYQRTAGPSSPLSPAPPPSPYDQYRRPPGGGPARISVAPNRLPEPYRDYNPRQPAPWSMQIGTRLTVKEGSRNPHHPDRRFYVQSQDQGQYAAPPARYARVEDDPRHRL